MLAFLSDRNVIQVFSDFTDKNPNGMLITEIPLSAVRAVTDEEKASQKSIVLLTKDSEYAKGWTVVLYWYNNQYGAIITGEGGAFRDDTTPECGF